MPKVHIVTANQFKQPKSSKNCIPYVKQSNFSSHLFLIASVSKILMYLKANLNSSASIISHQGNWTQMENSFAHNFTVKINLQWKFWLYKILQSKISHLIYSIVHIFVIFGGIICSITTSNHHSNAIHLYICDHLSVLYLTILVFKQNPKIFANHFYVQFAWNVQMYMVTCKRTT